MRYKLKYLPTAACVMLKRNPQFLSIATMDSLRDSIRRDGFVVPILVRPIGDGRYEILSGNHRWMAARELNLTEIPVVIAELSREQAARLAVNLNTVHGDPPVDTLVPFLAEMDDETLRSVHLDDTTRQQLCLFDATLENRLRELKPPPSVDRASKPNTIPTCVCKTCGKRHSPPAKTSTSVSVVPANTTVASAC